jgi:hypothetical protein
VNCCWGGQSTDRPEVKGYKDNSDDKVPDVAVGDPGANDVVDDADYLQVAEIWLQWVEINQLVSRFAVF